MPLAYEQRLGNGLVAWSPDGKYVAGVGIPGGAKAEAWIIGIADQKPPVRLIEFGEFGKLVGFTDLSAGLLAAALALLGGAAYTEWGVVAVAVGATLAVVVPAAAILFARRPPAVAPEPAG